MFDYLPFLPIILSYFSYIFYGTWKIFFTVQWHQKVRDAFGPGRFIQALCSKRDKWYLYVNMNQNLLSLLKTWTQWLSTRIYYANIEHISNNKISLRSLQYLKTYVQRCKIIYCLLYKRLLKKCVVTTIFIKIKLYEMC